MKRLVVALLLLPAAAGYVSAAGFNLPEQSAAALGMSAAFVGQADDASAVWYNPAAITRFEGTKLAAGVIAIAPDMKHENTNGTTDKAAPQIHLTPHFYATHKINDTMAAGMGINVPFGLATKWSHTSATKSVATLSDIRAININPTFAYKINNQVSAAAGISYVYLDAELDKMLGANEFKLTGKDSGWGANAALFYTPTEKIHVGATYRTEVAVKIEDGTAEFPAGTKNDASTKVTLPAQAAIGVSYKATPKLNVNCDVNFTGWSSYDKLVIKMPSSTSTDTKEWKDVWALRIGGQYELNDTWKLRAGYMHDNNPVPEKRFETRIPDSDRNGYSVGAGWKKGNIVVDAAYMYLRFNTREITASQAGGTTVVTALNGTYKAISHLAGLTVGYSF